MKKTIVLLLLAALVLSVFGGCRTKPQEPDVPQLVELPSQTEETPVQEDDMEELVIPPYDGKNGVIAIHGNVPYFSKDDLTTEPFETYSELDHLGRCGVAYANVCEEIMPKSSRGEIYKIRPSGWQTKSYSFIDGESLYNRSHLIAHSLAGEDANEKNLITGTRYFNAVGMLPYEEMVADYVHETGNHVLYRVTPFFTGTNLVADGVLMEALSVEDEGEDICYCVYVYNVQPGVKINYATGESEEEKPEGEVHEYVINIRNRKFHLPTCEGAIKAKEENKQTTVTTRELLIAQGFEPCQTCKP